MYTQRWVRDGTVTLTLHQYDGLDSFETQNHPSILPVDAYLQKHVDSGPLPFQWYFFKTHSGIHVGNNGSVPIFQSKYQAKTYQKVIKQRMVLCEKTLKELLFRDLVSDRYVFDFDPHLENIQQCRFLAILDIKRYII